MIFANINKDIYKYHMKYLMKSRFLFRYLKILEKISNMTLDIF